MILITGATGFIGSHLVEYLVSRKCKIRCMVLRDDPILKDIGKERERWLYELSVEVVYGDLLDKESLLRAVDGVEKAYHLAAISRPMNVMKRTYYDVNVDGTRNLAHACKEKNVKKIVHVSSMSVFGFSRDRKPLVEGSPKLPVSDYGESKKQGEEFVFEFCKENRIELVVVRPPMVFGPRDVQFLKLFKVINRGFFPLLKKGKAKFEFCYVKNLIRAIILADERGRNLEAYNINDGETYVIKEIFEEIARVENTKLLPFSVPVWTVRCAGLIFEKIYALFGKRAPFNSGTALWMSNDNDMDISKARDELAYERTVPIKDAIWETVEWYRKEELL